MPKCGDGSMIDKLKAYASQIKLSWQWLQDFLSLQGGLYIDAFAIVFLVRLIGPLKGLPAINPSEAAMWSATIAAFAASNIGGPKS